MLVVYINNDNFRHFITCDSDMMSLHAQLLSAVNVSSSWARYAAPVHAFWGRGFGREGVGVNEIMSCVYCSTERTTDTRFVYFLFQSTYIL